MFSVFLVFSVANILRVLRGPIAAAMAVVVTAATTTGQQAPPADPVFEFVSIQRNVSPDDTHVLHVLAGGRFEVRRAQVLALIRFAYEFDHLDPGRVVGEPWMLREYYDIFAANGRDWSIPPAEGVYPPELRPMLRALLDDRFGVRTRIEARPMPVQAIRLADPARGPGPGLRPSREECLGPYAVPGDDLAAPPRCPFTLETAMGSTRIEAQAASMADIARIVSRLLPFQDMAIDETGLEGTFDVSIALGVPSGFDLQNRYAREVRRVLLDELGLTLARTRAPVERLVVERARRPVED